MSSRMWQCGAGNSLACQRCPLNEAGPEQTFKSVGLIGSASPMVPALWGPKMPSPQPFCFVLLIVEGLCNLPCGKTAATSLDLSENKSCTLPCGTQVEVWRCTRRLHISPPKRTPGMGGLGSQARVEHHKEWE
jgi:hypothetical protein